MNNKSAIIVGAGVGGIATSIALARKGWKIRVYEKNANPGGRCGQFIRDGHRFDIGATLILMPSIYREVFNYLGLDLDECLDLKPIEDVYTLYFSSGRKLSFYQDRQKMKEQVEDFESGSFKAFEKYVDTGYEFFRIAMSDLLGKNYSRLTEFVSFRNMWHLLKMRTYMRHSTYVRRFFKDSDLQKAFSFQNIYVGQSPYQAPAFFSMLSAAELTEGTLFPVGGIHKVIEKLVSVAYELGVSFHYNSTVDEVIVKDGITQGVKLAGGKYEPADIVIINADLPNAYRNIIPDKREAKKLAKKKYSCSAFVFHWGLDKKYDKLGHHSIFLSDAYKRNLTKIFRDKALSETPSFYIHAPSRTDASAAPEGGDSLSVIVPVGHISQKHNQPWELYREMARKAVIKRLTEFGLDELESHIKFEACFTPLSWENSYRVEKGGVFGSLSHSIFQMGYFRPANRHSKFRHLYFVGGSTHPGNGVPLVLLSAKLTSERILQENS